MSEDEGWDELIDPIAGTARDRRARGLTTRTYDETQAGAVRVRCVVCGKEWDMTHPKPVCIACRG